MEQIELEWRLVRTEAVLKTLLEEIEKYHSSAYLSDAATTALGGLAEPMPRISADRVHAMRERYGISVIDAMNRVRREEIRGWAIKYGIEYPLPDRRTS